MAAPDDFLYEYAVIRFVPRVDREEFVNIGLVMMNKRHRWLKARVELDEKRLRALCPNVNMDVLSRQSALFEKNDVPARDLPVEERYRWLTAVKSACLQVSPSHPGIVFPDGSKVDSVAASMEREFERLFADLVRIS